MNMKNRRTQTKSSTITSSARSTTLVIRDDDFFALSAARGKAENFAAICTKQ